MEKKLSVKLKDGSLDSCKLTVEDHGAKIKIRFLYKDIFIEKEGDRPFFVLTDLRIELEKKGLLLVCNGSRRDVYPSRLSSEGFNAYVLKYGENAQIESLVDIFESTENLDLITTVQEQKNYYNNYIKS